MRNNIYLLLFIAYASVAYSSVPPNTNLKAQTFNFATAPLPSTPGLKPRYNVPLPADAQNIVDLTFGTNAPGATIKSVAELGNVAYFFSLFGDPSATRSAPMDGIPANFQGLYSFYPEFEADNVTRNPLAVHQVLSDRLRLVARSSMSGSAPGAKYEIGSIRLPTEFLPGMMAEITLAPGGWPTCKYSWPTFWAFSGAELQGAQGNVSRWYANIPLENDGFDGYPLDNSTQGTSIPTGCPIYTDQSIYSYPDDTFLQAVGDFRFTSSGGGGSGVNRLATNASNNPTDPNNVGLTVIMDWTDVNTVKYIYNGELVRIRHVFNAGTLTNGLYSGYDGTPPPANRLGTTMPMFLIVSHQFGVNFNPKDTAELNSITTPIVANYDVASIRMWNRASTMVPKSSTDSAGPIPPPVTGTALGDLPQISTGTFVMNVEVVNSQAVDHFGASVGLYGDTTIVTSGTNMINNKPVMFVGTAGGVSVQGPALSYAQNGGNFMLFMSVLNRNPFMGTNAIYCQLGRQYPMTDTFFDKPTLYQNPQMNLIAQLASSTTFDMTRANSTGKVNSLTSQLVVMNHSLAIDGTVTLGVGLGNNFNLPPAGYGVPVEQLAGYTELTLGSGRNKYNQLSGEANMLYGQVIMVAIPAGKTLSDADILAVSKYLTTKWNIGGTPNAAVNRTVSGMQPQPGTYKPPTKTSFTAVNAQTMTVNGGTTSPLILSQPAQTSNNTAMELMALPSGNSTFTALVTTNITYGIPIKNGVTFNGMNAGIALRNNVGNVSTFGIVFQNDVSASFRAYWYSPAAKSNGSYAGEQRRWYAASDRSFWLRVAVDSVAGTTSFLASATGRVNEWENLFHFNTVINNYTQIGFYVNAYAGPGVSGQATISVIHMDTMTTSSPQAQAGSYTSDFPAPKSRPTPAPTPKPTPKPTTAPTCPTYSTDFTAADSQNMYLSGITDGGFVNFDPSHLALGGGQMTFTLNNTGCPSGCGGAPYESAGWKRSLTSSYGWFNFTAKGPTPSGTCMYLEGTNTVNGKTSSIRMSLLGSQHSMIAFDVFVDGTQYLMAPIFVNFDHTAGYHTYSFAWTQNSVIFYADGKAIQSTTHSPSQPLHLQSTYEAASSTAQGWGTFSYAGPTTVSLASVYNYEFC